MEEVTGTETEGTEEVVETTESTETPEDGAKETTEWKPNYSYKVLDEEKQFDERLHGVIKDAETEKYVRDLYTKADGLDSYKKRYADLEAQAAQLVGGFNKLKEYRDNGDIASLSKALGVSNETLIEHVRSVLEEERLPEKDRRQIEESRKNQDRVKALEQRLASLTEEAESSRVDSDLRELEAAIKVPEISKVAIAMKKQGIDMVEEVLQAGHFEYTKTGKEPSVSSVVNKIAKKYEYLSKLVPTKQATLPKVNGSNQNAVGKPISSLDELRRLAATMD